MSNKALAFYLDGPLQAWGASSRFLRRETESYPTKSGIVGILAAALGIDKCAVDEAEQLRSLAALKLTTYLVRKKEQGHVQRLSDFHTVGGGWHDDWKQDKSNLVAKMSVPCKAGDSSPFGTVITHRTYLTGARFIAVLEGDTSTIERCAVALENPQWGVWFGRKNCLPATPLAPTLGVTKSEATQTLYEFLAERITGLEPCDITLALGQSEIAGDGTWFQPDQPLSFGKREYQSRPVQRNDAGAA